jgi:hypothetical protein
MFTIKDQKHFQDIRAEQSDKGLESLADRIMYLAGYGAGSFDIELTPDRDGFNILWLHADTGNHFMFGGLVHHRNDDTWSIHT